MTCPSDAPDLVVAAEAAIGLWIWSVWTWRLRNETNFRGLGAKNLLQEFQTYGYPIWVFKLVGAVKLTCASLLIVAIVYPCPYIALAGSAGMAFLMTVAVLSHFKVGDELSKNIPAFSMLTLSSFILYHTVTMGLESCPYHSVPARTIIGGAVAAVCFGMWLRSFLNGDYNLDNYEKLSAREKFDEPLLGA